MTSLNARSQTAAVARETWINEMIADKHDATNAGDTQKVWQLREEIDAMVARVQGHGYSVSFEAGWAIVQA